MSYQSRDRLSAPTDLYATACHAQGRPAPAPRLELGGVAGAHGDAALSGPDGCAQPAGCRHLAGGGCLRIGQTVLGENRLPALTSVDRHKIVTPPPATPDCFGRYVRAHARSPIGQAIAGGVFNRVPVASGHESTRRGTRRMAPPDLDRKSALFLDLDGTLLEIAATPELVVVPPALPAVLAHLHHQLERRRRDRERPADRPDRSPADTLPCLGRGRAWSLDPLLGRYARGTAGRHCCSGHVAEALNGAVERWPGVRVETKPHGVAVHYRLAPGARKRGVAARAGAGGRRPSLVSPDPRPRGGRDRPARGVQGPCRRALDGAMRRSMAASRSSSATISPTRPA